MVRGQEVHSRCTSHRPSPEFCIIPNCNSVAIKQQLALPPLPAPGNVYSTFLCLWVLTFQVPPISRIRYQSFCVRLISLSIMFSRFVHIVACVRICFLLRLITVWHIYIHIYVKYIFYPHTHHTWSIHPSIDIWVISTFGLLWIMLMSVGVQYSFKTLLSNLLGIFRKWNSWVMQLLYV